MNSKNTEESKKFIRQCVIEQLKNILESDNITDDDDVDIPVPNAKKPSVKSNNKKVVICECGKDITKCNKPSLEMHNRSKYHIENI